MRQPVSQTCPRGHRSEQACGKYEPRGGIRKTAEGRRKRFSGHGPEEIAADQAGIGMRKGLPDPEDQHECADGKSAARLGSQRREAEPQRERDDDRRADAESSFEARRCTTLHRDGRNTHASPVVWLVTRRLPTAGHRCNAPLTFRFGIASEIPRAVGTRGEPSPDRRPHGRNMQAGLSICGIRTEPGGRQCVLARKAGTHHPACRGHWPP